MLFIYFCSGSCIGCPTTHKRLIIFYVLPLLVLLLESEELREASWRVVTPDVVTEKFLFSRAAARPHSATILCIHFLYVRFTFLDIFHVLSCVTSPEISAKRKCPQHRNVCHCLRTLSLQAQWKIKTNKPEEEKLCWAGWGASFRQKWCFAPINVAYLCQGTMLRRVRSFISVFSPVGGYF